MKLQKLRDLRVSLIGLGVCWIILVPVLTFAAEPDSLPAPVTRRVEFTTEIQPILRQRCLGCHGPEAQMSGFRVDVRERLIAGGDFGEPAVIPGKSGDSLLVWRVAGSDSTVARMPPVGEPLSQNEIALLRAWIDQGVDMPETDISELSSSARHPDHWSFQQLRPVRPPELDNPWVLNPIDSFVLARLNKERLAPSSSADPRTLIRRVYQVMHGVPPSPEELTLFASDSQPDAYEKLVERVLASPRYGERWAQHWLDVIRFAETWGYETNAFREDAYHFRDWVIRALNEDKPYDQFVFEQLAGDTIGVDAATGFLVAGPANLPGQIGKNVEAQRQARQDELDEIVVATSAAFLGLTVGCARCHNHKFDPITQTDYYSLQAAFAGVHYGARRLRGVENDRWQAQLPAVEHKLKKLRSLLEAKLEQFGLRPPLDPDRTEERFDSIKTESMRMQITATSDGKPARLYEFEIWSTEGAGSAPNETTKNVALAKNGGRSSASSFAFENQTRHPDNLIDGKREFPWKAKTEGPAWIQVDLSQSQQVDRIVWQGEDTGFPVDYEIEALGPDGQWRVVARSRDRLPHLHDLRKPEEVRLTGVPEKAVAELVQLLASTREVDTKQRRLARGPQVFAGSFGEPEEIYRLRRGDPMQRGERLTPDVPALLGRLDLGDDAGDAQARAALARHIVSTENPLTARVMVNRIWQYHFGVGIVDTPSDFGTKGSRPTHPELLDWLANEFIQSGWSIKHVQRLILHSNTFRQRSTSRTEAEAVDSGSRLLWRFPPRRLEAEVIRDSILHVSGKLNLEMFGPGFDFFNKRGGLEDSLPKDSATPTEWRRMLYATKIRMETIDIFGAFDCPDGGQLTPRRTRSITPVQALNLFNGNFVAEQAKFFAERVHKEAGPELEHQIQRAFFLAFGRSARAEEMAALERLGEKHGLGQVCRVLFNLNEFVFVQ